MHDSLITSVPRQQFDTVWKEVGTREAVVLEDDRFLDLGEHPVDPARYTDAAAEVCIGVVSQHLTRPVDAIDDRAHLPAPFGLTGPVGAGAVGDDQQCLRPRRGDGVEHLAGGVGTIEDQKGDGGLQHGVDGLPVGNRPG